MSPRQNYTDRDYFDEKFANIDKRLDVFDKILNGNGHEGLISRVDRGEDSINDLHQEIFGDGHEYKGIRTAVYANKKWIDNFSAKFAVVWALLAILIGIFAPVVSATVEKLLKIK